MASGFKSGSLPHAKYLTTQINLPTMHIYGLNDQIIPKDMSVHLASLFQEAEPTVVIHDGGHYLPANGSQKHDYQKFFKLCLLQKQYVEKIKNDVDAKKECSN